MHSRGLSLSIAGPPKMFPPIKCSLCPQTLATEADIKYHYFSEHVYPDLSSDFGLTCLHCKSTSRNPSSVRTHLDFCMKLLKQCPHCPNKVATADRLGEHIAREHGCLCGKFNSSDADSYLKIHVAVPQKGEDVSQWKRGPRTSHEEQTLADIRARLGLKPVEYQRVRQNAPQVETPPPRARGIITQPAVLVSKPAEQLYRPKVSPQVPTSEPRMPNSAANRTKAQNQHTSTAPNRCSLCPYRSNPSKVARHYRYVHSQEKPHACGLCEKRFTDKADLTRHLKVVHDYRHGVNPTAPDSSVEEVMEVGDVVEIMKTEINA